MKKILCLLSLFACLIGMLAPRAHAQPLVIYDFTNSFTGALGAGVVGATFSDISTLMTNAPSDPGVSWPPAGYYWLDGDSMRVSRNGSSGGWGFANTLAPLAITVTAGANYDVSVSGVAISQTLISGLTFQGRIGYETAPGNNTPGNYTANGVLVFGTAVTVPAGTSLKFFVDLNSNASTTQHDLLSVTLNGTTTLVGASPDLVSYAQNPAKYAIGDIVSNAPTYENGTPTNFTVLPALPAGLGIVPTSGVITGTPSAIVAAADYAVTAEFDNASTDTLNVNIEIANPALLSYSPASLSTSVGSSLPSVSPVLFGQTTPTNFSITPALPAGVSLNTGTGAITGAPTETATNTHTITANYAAFPDSAATFTLTVTLPSFSYKDNDYVMATNQVMRNATVTLVGIAPTNFTIAPTLPAGLSLNPVTGEISGTPTATQAATTYVVTGQYDLGLADVSVTNSIRVVDAFADDFNYASGTLSGNSLWTHQLGNTGFALNGAIVSGSPTGSDNLGGPTVTLNDSSDYAGGDLTASVQTQFPLGSGVAGGLIFGLQDSQNFWTFQLKNGSQASGNLNTDIFIRYRKAGVVTTVLEANWLTNAVGDQFYTLTMKYDADTGRLKFEARRQNNSLYFSYNYQLDVVNDLAIAANSLCGIQTFTSGASQFENLWGSYDAVSIAPAAFSITSITHDPTTGATSVTWPSETGESYSLLKADTADVPLAIMNPAINGNGGSVTSTHTNNATEGYYRVKRN